MIGGVTILVGDLASLLGCVLDMPDEITAITLVALGTSLPDTFASKVAAQQDPYADASVGNVTGSNSVNVFLGLGLPWTIGAFYWKNAFDRKDEKLVGDWMMKRALDGRTYKDAFLGDYGNGGFMVPAGNLGFSVLVFTICAFVALGILIVRRIKYGGELGGPPGPKNVSAVLLCLLWVTYVGASCYQFLVVNKK